MPAGVSQGGAKVPPEVDRTLQALGSRPDLPPAVSSRLASIFRSVIRAFGQSPVDRGEIEKALEKIQRCWASVQSETGGQAPVVAELGALSTLLAERLAAPEPEPVLYAPVSQAPAPRASAPPAPAPVFFPPEPIHEVGAWPRPAWPEEPRATFPAPSVLPFSAPSSAPSSAPPPPVPDSPKPPVAPRLAIERPRRPGVVARAVLDRLCDLIQRRARILANPLSLFSALAGSDGQMQDALSSAGFIAEEMRPRAEAALADAESEDDRAAAALALFQCGGAGAVVAHLSERMAAATGGDGTNARMIGLDGPLLALRLSGDPAVLAHALPLLATATGDARAAVLAALADAGLLAADTLIDLLDDASDAVAVRAADLLAWIGRAPTDRALIEERLRLGASPARYDSLLFAAVALGSPAALGETRRMLDAAQPVTARAVDTLAVAGGPGDAEKLLALAARDETLAARATLAAAHLGDHAGERWIDDGQPWTMAAALDRLAAGDQPIVSRAWYALEAGVRTGVRAGVVFDATARAGVQQQIAAEIRRAVENAGRPPAAGRWFYFGRPVG